MGSYLMHSYNRLSLHPESGEGCWVKDRDGKRYLDALGGIAVCALGHANPAVTRAICEQAKRLSHVSNLYHIDQQEALGTSLCEVADMQRAFICNSGAEANEAAIKIARLYGSSRKIENPQIIVMNGAFHGRTMATLTATGNRKIQAGFEPLVQGFLRAPYNDIEALRQIANNSKNVVAVMLEPVQGEGGIVIPDHGYLAAVREICDANQWLMMLDEIQTGMGRTGEWFAWMHENARPDVITVAKALGNGFPIGACLSQGEAADLITPGSHGTTFGGNPLGCHVAATVINEIREQNLVARAAELGERMLQGLQKNLADHPVVRDIRGKGLMLGVELNQDCASLMQDGINAGILINVTAGNVVRLLPPFTLKNEEADEIVRLVTQLIENFGQQSH